MTFNDIVSIEEKTGDKPVDKDKSIFRRYLIKDDWKIQGKPALIILHMQQGIVGERGMSHCTEWLKEAGIIPRQQALLKAFRDKKLPIIFISALHISRIEGPVGVLPAYGDLLRRAEVAEPIPDGLEVIPELAPQSGEPVLVNWCMGAFTNSGLDQVLKVFGADTVVLAGFATPTAVYTAAIQAVDLWYSVIIVSDACISMPTQLKAHETVMEIMGPTIGLVTSADDVIAHL